MTKKQIRNFSAEEKTRVVLELLKEESTVGQLSLKYEVTAKSIHNWKKQFLENAALAFDPAKIVSEYKEEINKLKEKWYRYIGQFYSINKDKTFCLN